MKLRDDEHHPEPDFWPDDVERQLRRKFCQKYFYVGCGIGALWLAIIGFLIYCFA